MAKKALYYTIRRGLYSSNWEVMTVTSELGTRKYGRNTRGEPTNAAGRDCRGRFDTEDAASAVLASIAECAARHQKIINECYAAERAARDARDAEITQIIAKAGGR